MRYRRPQTPTGQFVDFLLTVDGDFTVPADEQAAQIAAAVGVPTLVMEEGAADPWDGVSALLPVPPGPQPQPSAQEQAIAAVQALDTTTIVDPAVRAAFELLRDAALGERQPREFTVLQTGGLV